MSLEPITERYADLTEVALTLGVHWVTVQRLAVTGKLPTRKVHGKRLVERAVLEYWKANYDPKQGPKTFPGEMPS
jgi:hypothetical protein